MYVAVITVCHMYMANACFDLVDEWGPYKTEKECRERIEEMIVATDEVWKDHNLLVLVADKKCETANVGV